MIEFSAEFGNIEIRVQITPYLGATEALALSAEDRSDLEKNDAQAYELRIWANQVNSDQEAMEFIVPAVVIGLYEDDEEVSKDEAMAEEALDLIEEAFLEKIVLHFELEDMEETSRPQWALDAK